MESLSSVATVVKIVQDIAAAVSTVSRNRSRCLKVANRVHAIGDLLKELQPVSSTTMDAATRKLLRRLEEALRRALKLVRECQGSACPLSLVAGGRMAGRFDDVDGEINDCLLDLNVATLIQLDKLIRRNAVPAPETSSSTVTLRIGMPRDDNVAQIKRCIRNMQGVTDVAAADVSSKDQFTVTVRSGAVDIPSLLENVEEKLNRNVELVAPAVAATKSDAAGADGRKLKYSKADDVKGAAEEGRAHNRKHLRHATGDEVNTEKAPVYMVGSTNQAPAAPYAYLPFAVALVPIGDAAGMNHAPSPYSFLPYPQGPPGNDAHPYRHRVATPARKYDAGGGRDKKDAVKPDGGVDTKEKFAADSGNGGKEEDAAAFGGGGERKKYSGDKTATAGNVTAIGVPVRTVTAGMHELMPPSYGYGYWPYAQGQRNGDYYNVNSGGAPSAAAAAAAYYYGHHYSSYPDMFSDENPNACSIM